MSTPSTAAKRKFFLIVEIDHSSPYYDDSYSVNSENLGPYGDANTDEFIPAWKRNLVKRD